MFPLLSLQSSVHLVTITQNSHWFLFNIYPFICYFWQASFLHVDTCFCHIISFCPIPSWIFLLEPVSWWKIFSAFLVWKSSSPFLVEDVFSEYWLTTWHTYFLPNFKGIVLCALERKSLVLKSVGMLAFVPLYTTHLFLWVVLRIFSLSLTFRNLIMVCLGVVFFVLSLLEFFEHLGYVCLQFSYNDEKPPAIISPNIFSAPFSLLILRLYVRLQGVQQVTLELYLFLARCWSFDGFLEFELLFWNFFLSPSTLCHGI